MTATAVAAVTGYSAYWIGQIARRYNADGPDGVRDRRYGRCAGRPDLPAAQLPELRAALAGLHPDGDCWCGRTVAPWLAERLGRQVGRQLGWRSMWRLGTHWRKASAAPHAGRSAGSSRVQGHLRPLLRQVATAFPRPTVELWMVDEHRIGLKPILKKLWMLPTFPDQCPIAPVKHRYDWRSLVGFVHLASGRTVWHLATTVNIAFFSIQWPQALAKGPDRIL